MVEVQRKKWKAVDDEAEPCAVLTEGWDELRRLVDVEEGDAAAPEAAQGPSQQPERLLR